MYDTAKSVFEIKQAFNIITEMFILTSREKGFQAMWIR